MAARTATGTSSEVDGEGCLVGDFLKNNVGGDVFEHFFYIPPAFGVPLSRGDG